MPRDKARPAAKRAAFRVGLRSGELLRFPDIGTPLSAMLIQRHGFEGVYARGAAVSAGLGVPDTRLTTLPGATGRIPRIARATALPVVAERNRAYIHVPIIARTTESGSGRLAGRTLRNLGST
jgi:methylisocitrate lyase